MDGAKQEKSHLKAFKEIVRRSKSRNRRSDHMFVDARKAAKTTESVQRALIARMYPFTNIHQSSAVSVRDDCHSTGGYMDPGFNFNDMSGCYDLTSNPQHCTLDDISLFLQHHDSNLDPSVPLTSPKALSPSTDTLDFLWSSSTDVAALNDVLSDKLSSEAMQVSQATYAFSPSHDDFQPQECGLSTAMETTPSTKVYNHYEVSSEVVTMPATKVPTSILTQKERKAWGYYTEIIFPAMFPFLPFDDARKECKKAVKACQNLVTFLRHIMLHTEQYQASELKRFGIWDSKIPLSAQYGEQSMIPQIYGGCEGDNILHLLLAQINVGGKEWPEMISWLSSNILAREGDSNHAKEILSYFEVLASTMTGSQPSLAIRHLTEQESNCDNVTGIDTWLLDCLIRIVQLQRWKSDQLSNESLSIHDLMSKSQVIDDNLKRERTRRDPVKSPGDSARSTFMKVFEAATALFLQCAIFEARPEIAEIQHEVSNTIDALKDLPQALLLKRLAWPVCIAASMAIKSDQQKFFKSLY
ncbi:fungal-specific transcription factor domain-containing protein [Calycina marina]|uniref:Fungal-specific transcription factor domain-containing protein n=1 Tax=Calycina marina TaxID=1763456 RepID=A0A9P7Z129_9HELO|nr:fungal-specific transcription factor domain-containing protein [Calycina marina]